MSDGEGIQKSHRYCGDCGAQAKPGNAFCTSCGALLDEERGSSTEAFTTPAALEFTRDRGSLPGDRDVRAALRGVGTLLLVVAACFAFAYSLVLGLVLAGLLVLTLRAFGRSEDAHTVAGQRLLAAFESWWFPNSKSPPDARESPVREGAATSSPQVPDLAMQGLDAAVFAIEAVMHDLDEVLKGANAVENAAFRAVWWCLKVATWVTAGCAVGWYVLPAIVESEGIGWFFIMIAFSLAVPLGLFALVWRHSSWASRYARPLFPPGGRHRRRRR